MRRHGIVVLLALVTACETGLLDPGNLDPDVPSGLFYRLIPSGDPGAPLGIVLEWTPPSSGRAVTYDVYARSSAREDFALRATTTSPSFHDAGIPQLEYFVEALDADGQRLGRTESVIVDERNRLPAPRGLTSTTLNGGIQLAWDPNSYDAAPALFDLYRVYSTSYDRVRGCADADWALEGTTVSDEFVVRSLENGVTRCFAVSAISVDGHESVWSNLRLDTPRYDARSIVLDAVDVRRLTSGLAVWSGSGRAGRVVADTNAAADLVLERRSDGLWLRAVRAEVRIAPYGAAPVSELTSIDRAPAVGYVDAVRVTAGFGFVVRTQRPEGIYFAALRVVNVSADFILFDFAFQSQVGSGELLRATP